MTLKPARLVAPGIHLAVFALTWILYACQRQPLLNGPSRWPFLLVFVADLPIAMIAFAVMFTSEAAFPYALAAWALLGTMWWYFIGLRFLSKKLAAK
jgi:hypothetical protein